MCKSSNYNKFVQIKLFLIRKYCFKCRNWIFIILYY